MAKEATASGSNVCAHMELNIQSRELEEPANSSKSDGDNGVYLIPDAAQCILQASFL